jgi:hypothetical protein
VIARLVIGMLGIAAAAYGVALLLGRSRPDLIATVIWLGAGVALHDLVLVPLTLAVCWLGMRLIAPGPRAAVASGFVVLGTLTLLAVPVLGRFGARPDNPTLLDRDYTAGWLVVAALTLAAVGVGVLLTRGRSRGPGARRR